VAVPGTLGLVGPAAPWAGGVVRFTSDLAAQLRTRGDVSWLSWRTPRRVPPGTELDSAAAADPFASPVLGLLDRASWRVAGEHLRGCPAVVLTVTHPLLLAPYRRLLSAYGESGGRVVMVCHNVLPHDATPLAGLLAGRLLRYADRVLVHAASEAELAARLCPSAEIVRAFHPAGQAPPWQSPPGRARLLAFGYVRPYKGIADLLAALPFVPDAELRVVGRFWEPIARYERLVERLGLQGRVTLENRYVADADVPSLIAQCDVVVCPYRQASQSGVVHVAYSHGRAVAATRVGGLAEAVLDGRTGALAAPRDATALADAIVRALALPRPGLEAAIRAVLAERTWQRYTDLVLEASHA
jgi:glycosyltransferase involved in cell wall biosynthesis